MSLIAFANLTSWHTQGFHTVSVGFAMSSDVEETAADLGEVVLGGLDVAAASQEWR
jgi:hypothetical protein